MIGQPVFTFSFKRKDKAKTLGDMSAIRVAPDRTIDPALLFQRFLVVSNTGDISLPEVMSYELSPFPPALFEARNVLRKADKPQLAHAIMDHSSKVSCEAITDKLPKTEHYVLDGGSLLHRLPWKTGDSYGAIAQSYALFTIMVWPLWSLMGTREVHLLKTIHTNGVGIISIHLLVSLQIQSFQERSMIFCQGIATNKH